MSASTTYAITGTTVSQWLVARRFIQFEHDGPPPQAIHPCATFGLSISFYRRIWSDLSDLYSDEGQPIGEVESIGPGFFEDLRSWLLRWN